MSYKLGEIELEMFNLLYVAVFIDGSPLASHHPTLLIKQATTQLLQSLTICAGVHADGAEKEAIRTLSGLLRTLVDAGCSQALS